MFSNQFAVCYLHKPTSLYLLQYVTLRCLGHATPWRGQDTEGVSVQDTADSATANMAPYILVPPSNNLGFQAPLERRFANVVKKT